MTSTLLCREFHPVRARVSAKLATRLAPSINLTMKRLSTTRRDNATISIYLSRGTTTRVAPTRQVRTYGIPEYVRTPRTAR